MKHVLSFALGWLLAASLSCGSPDQGDPQDSGPLDGDARDGDAQELSVQLRGAVEKGPFVLGSSVAVSLIDRHGNPTGRVFNTFTTNDLGEFEVSLLLDRFVSLEATGFYYNEATGELSGANITLRAFAQITEPGTQSAYINIITHLSYGRVQTLIGQGTELGAAISQAEGELRTGLGVGTASFDPNAAGAQMNIIGGDSDANAYLFAVSAVLAQAALLRGGPVDAALQELANGISADLASDGQLAESTTSALREAQRTLDADQVMSHLAARLDALGSSAEVPQLNRVLDQDFDGQVNAEDCLPFDSSRMTGQADLDGDGQAHVLCGGDDCDDNCPSCHSGAAPECGGALDHDCDGLVDDVLGCGVCEPGEPTVVASTEAYVMENMFLAGDRLHLARDGAVEVWDVSDPSTPVLAGSMVTAAAMARDVAVRGELAYYAADSGGALVVDVSADAPELAATITAEREVHSVFVADHLAYFLNWGGELIVMDLVDPSMPELTAVLWIGCDPTRLFAQGDVVYVAGDCGLMRVDVTDPAAPQTIGEPLAVGAYVADLQVAGDIAYVLSGDGLATVDVSDPVSPSVLSEPLPLTHMTMDARPRVVVRDTYAFVLATGEACDEHDCIYTAGMTIFDVSQADAPAEVAFFSLADAVSDNVEEGNMSIAVAGRYAYVSCPLLHVIDLGCIN